jgi:hypothetical protein
MPAQGKCVTGGWRIFFLVLEIPVVKNFKSETTEVPTLQKEFQV